MRPLLKFSALVSAIVASALSCSAGEPFSASVAGGGKGGGPGPGAAGGDLSNGGG